MEGQGDPARRSRTGKTDVAYRVSFNPDISVGSLMAPFSLRKPHLGSGLSFQEHEKWSKAFGVGTHGLWFTTGYCRGRFFREYVCHIGGIGENEGVNPSSLESCCFVVLESHDCYQQQPQYC